MVKMDPFKNSKNSIPEFYNGKSVFITGGTGFLGKVLIEKLLRSCPEIENVYLLVRSKKGKNAEERLAELTSSQAFDTLREKNPQALKKIILIEGDISEIGLGISEENRELLCDKVSVIFNSAANVKFDKQLKDVINANLRSLDELIKLSRQLKDLKSFIHISTAYSNWFELDVKEQFYPTTTDPHYIMDLCNLSSESEINEKIKSLLGKHVNTYTFSKALAEDLVLKTAKDLPIAIVRPSIVGASMTEPEPGWVDSYTAGTPYVDQIARGIFRSFHCDKNVIFDLIPVDLVINLTIAASWKVAQNKHLRPAISEPIIYNSNSGNSNPLTINQYAQSIRDAGRKYPSDMMTWYPQARFYKTKLLSDIDCFVTHLIPAFLTDGFALIKGERGSAIKHIKRSKDAYDQISFIMNTPIELKAKNYQKLQESMNKTDQQDFNFDPRTINWKNYIDSYHIGVRKFIFNDKSIGTVAAQRKFSRLKYANYILSGLIIAFLMMPIIKVGIQFINKNAQVVTSLNFIEPSCDCTSLEVYKGNN